MIEAAINFFKVLKLFYRMEIRIHIYIRMEYSNKCLYIEKNIGLNLKNKKKLLQ